MKVLVFQTNIHTPQKVHEFHQIFDQDGRILKWTIDTEDVDNVLRMETTDNVHELDVINTVTKHGFQCAELV